LEGRVSSTKLTFTNVKEVWKRSSNGDIERVYSSEPFEAQHVKLGTVIVELGRMTCIGLHCSDSSGNATEIDLHGGTISPGLMSYGSPLGLEEIASELSTSDGESFDAFRTNVPKILDDVGGVVRAMDALMFSTRNAL
jgi:imidazolonepropionase-like amidohydrolase